MYVVLLLLLLDTISYRYYAYSFAAFGQIKGYTLGSICAMSGMYSEILRVVVPLVPTIHGLAQIILEKIKWGYN